MAMRVLLVEDDADVVETLRSTIAPGGDFTLEVETNFETAVAKVNSYRPDMVILDLYEDALEQDKGKPVWEQIWATSFCPIIFHTAHDAPPSVTAIDGHPFVKYVKKRAGSDAEVLGHLKTYSPHVLGVRTFGSQVEKELQNVLKVVAPLLWKAQSNIPANAEILTRAAKRRLAATIDHAEIVGVAISHWEQYIVPVLGADPLMGDIIKVVGSDSSDANSFRVNLTPSCDCVSGRAGRTANLLVAKCKPMAEFLRATGLAQAPEATKKEKLKSIVTLDHTKGLVPLPAFQGLLPALAVSLKELELLPIDSVGNTGTAGIGFERVVSIDSPFREKIAWAYLQISGRPGIPECNPDHLIDSIARA